MLKGLVGKETVDSQHGLVWKVVPILAQRGLALSIVLINIHVLIICCLCYKYAFLLHSYFSPLQVKNRPLDKDTKHGFILGPTSLVANSLIIS